MLSLRGGRKTPELYYGENPRNQAGTEKPNSHVGPGGIRTRVTSVEGEESTTWPT